MLAQSLAKARRPDRKAAAGKTLNRQPKATVATIGLVNVTPSNTTASFDHFSERSESGPGLRDAAGFGCRDVIRALSCAMFFLHRCYANIALVKLMRDRAENDQDHKLVQGCGVPMTHFGAPRGVEQGETCVLTTRREQHRALSGAESMASASQDARRLAPLGIWHSCRNSIGREKGLGLTAVGVPA